MIPKNCQTSIGRSILIYLDTHVVVWFYTKTYSKLSQNSQQLIQSNDLLISPIVRLELSYLHQIGRVITDPVSQIMADLSQRIGLAVCTKPFDDVVTAANSMTWTRDPFDRIIAAHASLDNTVLVTRDRTILANYVYAKW